MKQALIVLLLALLMPFTDKLAAQSPAQATFVKAGGLLNPRTGNVVSPAAVLIQGDKIKEVGAPAQVQAHVPAGAKTIDLGGATLLPGLIDGHTHLFLDIVVPPDAEQDRHSNGLFAPDCCWPSWSRRASAR
jgi:imidazolonepropionase-like amidohydrolase